MKKTLSPDTISEIAKKLSHFLADTFVLYVKTLNFHWNMVGQEFYMYHKLLEKQYEEMQEGADVLAERIRQLGERAPGSMKSLLELACLNESEGEHSQESMIQILVDDHESLVEHCHEMIEYMDEVLDQGTSDLLVERIRAHSKHAWMLRSHFTGQ